MAKQDSTDDMGIDNPATHDVGDDNGVDDPATHDVGDDNGVDDPATHDVGDDNGVDDPATHDVGDDNGVDDPATHDVGDDNGVDDPVTHDVGDDNGVDDPATHDVGDDNSIHRLVGSAGNDQLAGYAGDDVLDGGGGIDLARYNGQRAEAMWHKTSAGWTVTSAPDDTDMLINVERLKFSDISVALDLSGNAGTVAKTLGAVFGSAETSNEVYAGIGLYYIDARHDVREPHAVGHRCAAWRWRELTGTSSTSCTRTWSGSRPAMRIGATSSVCWTAAHSRWLAWA